MLKRGFRAKLALNSSRSRTNKSADISDQKSQGTTERKQQELGKSVGPLMKLNRFKMVLILYELHHVDRNWLQSLRGQLYLEYSCIGFKSKFRIKTRSLRKLFSHSEDGTLQLDKMRLYYFFSNRRISFQQYINNGGVSASNSRKCSSVFWESTKKR